MFLYMFSPSSIVFDHRTCFVGQETPLEVHVAHTLEQTANWRHRLSSFLKEIVILSGAILGVSFEVESTLIE